MPTLESFTFECFFCRKSDPEKIYFQRSQPEDFEVTHLFSVGNSGPSPIKLDLTILVPVVKHEDKDIFEFSKVSSLLNHSTQGAQQLFYIIFNSIHSYR